MAQTFEGGSITTEKGEIIIRIKPVSQGRSATGKTEIFATTRGAVAVSSPDGGAPFKLNLNLYR